MAEIPDGVWDWPPVCEEEPSLGLVWDWVSIADSSTMDDDEVLTLLHECARIRSFVDARELRALARFAELRPAGGGAGWSEFAGDEVAVELRVTPGYADDQLHLAVALDTRLRATRDALAAGLIDKARATAVVELTDPLPADKAQAVEQQVLRRAPEQNLAQLRRSLRYRVARVDPEGKHGHRAKHEAGWQLSQPLPGYFVWVTPAGRTVVVEPEPIAEPEAELWPEETPPPF